MEGEWETGNYSGKETFKLSLTGEVQQKKEKNEGEGTPGRGLCPGQRYGVRKHRKE